MKKFSILILLFLFLIPFVNKNEIEASGSDFIFIGTNTGKLTKLDSNGNIIWTNTHNTSQINDIFVSLDNHVYTVAFPDLTSKFDFDGNLIWSRVINPTSIFGTSDTEFSIAVDSQDFVFTSSRYGKLTKTDQNGTQIWQQDFFNFNFVPEVYIDIDQSSNVYVNIGSNPSNLNQPFKKYDFNGNLIWNRAISVGDAVRTKVSPNDNFVVFSTTDNNIRKYDLDGNIQWTFTNHSNRVHDLAIDLNDNIFTASFDQTVRKINLNGAQVWSYSYGNLVFAVDVDKEGFVYAGGSGGSLRKLNNNGSLQWNITPHSGETIHAIGVEPLIDPEPPFYDINLSSNYPNFIDLIYTDITGTSIGSEINTVIANDVPFSVTSTVIDTTPFTFNFWLDLDTQTIFSTDRTFDILNPTQNYNLQANFTLNNAIMINLDSNLPSPPDFNLIVDTLENNTNAVIQYPFNNFQIPFGYNFSIEAPTDQVGFYEFDFWYDNIQDRVFTTSAIISLEALENYDLTAIYSLPEEFQISLTLETNVGPIIFQHGNLPPISGSVINVTIGQGDSWTATAPLTPNFQFFKWEDEETLQIFSNNRILTVNNTTRNYILRAYYFQLVTVNWDSLGGTPIPSQKIIIGSQINAPENPIRPNFAFGGWALPSSPNTPENFPQTINQNITYQAIWLPTYQLTFNTNGGQPIQSQIIIENDLPNVVTPSRFGYTFEGWFTDNVTFNNQFDFNQPFTSNTTIHAKWTFGTTANAETSLQSFLGNARLDNPLAQWIIVLSLFILLNVMIFIYKGPFIVTVILNFILTALFIVFGFIPIWITIVLFMAIFGFMILMLTGGRS